LGAVPPASSQKWGNKPEQRTDRAEFDDSNHLTVLRILGKAAQLKAGTSEARVIPFTYFPAP